VLVHIGCSLNPLTNYAILTFMKEPITRRRAEEAPLETAARLREKHGIRLGKKAKTPLPSSVYYDMWGRLI
jgi:antitoxin VapB